MKLYITELQMFKIFKQAINGTIIVVNYDLYHFEKV